MAYADHKENKAAAIGSAILIQAGIGAALFTGLVVTTTTKQKDPPLPIEFVTIPPAPEPVPEPEPVEIAARPETPQPRINVPVPVVRTPSPVDLTTTTAITPILPPVLPPAPEPRILRVEPPVPPAVDLSRALAPRGNVGAWFPQDSYPPAARRAGVEGRVSVSLAVNADGRVAACSV
ncbi:MAG TPA: energy transducer TonB, partial [Sphingomonas sp.]